VPHRRIRRVDGEGLVLVAMFLATSVAIILKVMPVDV
jgi:hypothetical protein